eukprot:scaffold2961_cov263-Prasinococcus_capsulatus_cf.AAC.3
MMRARLSRDRGCRRGRPVQPGAARARAGRGEGGVEVRAAQHVRLEVGQLSRCARARPRPPRRAVRSADDGRLARRGGAQREGGVVKQPTPKKKASTVAPMETSAPAAAAAKPWCVIC